jgi:tryptophan synthase alpha chain
MQKVSINRIDKIFADNKRVSRKTLIVYITCGFPDIKTTEELVPKLNDAGADIIELGIPFSDPIADGKTIQYSGQKALENGTTLNKIFPMAKRIRKKTPAGLVLMGYYNSILAYGKERFINDCKRIGIDGVIIPDLIPEEAGEMIKLAGGENIKLIFLAAPNTKPNRLKIIGSYSTGFVYSVSITGTTGGRNVLPDIDAYIQRVKKHTILPVSVGFGISNSKQAKKAGEYADGVIIGSALIKIMIDNPKHLQKKSLDFVGKIRKGLDAK